MMERRLVFMEILTDSDLGLVITYRNKYFFYPVYPRGEQEETAIRFKT